MHDLSLNIKRILRFNARLQFFTNVYRKMTSITVDMISLYLPVVSFFYHQKYYHSFGK